MDSASHRTSAPILGVLLLLLLAAAPCAPTPAAPAQPTPLTGTVRDSVGNLLSGVEVLLVRLPSSSFVPAAVARSDRSGRFEVAGLAPGRYRIAALKEGYRTHLGQIDTLARSAIDLVLHPARAADVEDLPDDASWALRVPRRGMLHDTGATVAAAEERSPSLTGTPLTGSMRMEVDQLFSVGAAAARSDPGDAGIRPSETRMRLASRVGERGRFHVEGRRERLRASGPESSTRATAARAAESVRFDLAYDTGPAARLAVRAYYDQTDRDLSSAAAAPMEQRHRTWGYDASWSTQLETVRRLAVAVRARGASVTGPGRSSPALRWPVADSNGPVTLSGGAFEADGSVEAVMSDAHEVRIALTTQQADSPATEWATRALVAPVADRTPRTVRADARHRWSVTAPFSLVYGFAYEQVLDRSAAALIVPRVGGDLRVGRGFLRGSVSYHATAGAEEASGPVARGGDGAVGYRASLELPLADDVRLSGGVSHRPLQLGFIGYLPGSREPGDYPLYLTSGNSAVWERRLALSEDRGPLRTYFELSDGRAEGELSPLLAFEGLLPIRSETRLRYWNGRFGVACPRVGTHVRVEYQRIESGNASRPAEEVASLQESVEMRVKQDLWQTPFPGDWRLLLAVRLGRVRSEDIEDRLPVDGVASVDALHRRVDAGVSVGF